MASGAAAKSPKPSWWEVLGVSCDATFDTVTRAFHSEQIKWQPSKRGHQSTQDFIASTAHLMAYKEFLSAPRDPETGRHAAANMACAEEAKGPRRRSRSRSAHRHSRNGPRDAGDPFLGEDVNSLTVKVLQERLRQKGLPTGGLKAQLVTRLACALRHAQEPVDGRCSSAHDRVLRLATGTLGVVQCTNPLRVKWSVDFQAGSRHVSASQITKCKSQEFQVVGDVVKATYDLNYPQCATQSQFVIKKDTLGTITCLAPLSVAWPEGNRQVLADGITKCYWNEFQLVGDVVKATRDLNYPQCATQSQLVIKKDTFGKITDIASNGRRSVMWGDGEGNSSNRQVMEDDITKCKSNEFQATAWAGDLVKATRDLTYSSRLPVLVIKKDTIGKITSVRPLAVEWPAGSGVAGRQVMADAITKCKSNEILRVGDAIKAACDLSYPH